MQKLKINQIINLCANTTTTGIRKELICGPARHSLSRDVEKVVHQIYRHPLTAAVCCKICLGRFTGSFWGDIPTIIEGYPPRFGGESGRTDGIEGYDKRECGEMRGDARLGVRSLLLLSRRG